MTPPEGGSAEPDAELWLIESPDVPDVLKQGAAHLALGGLLDAGTSAVLRTDGGPRPAPGASWRQVLEKLCGGFGGRIRLCLHDGALDAGFRARIEPVAMRTAVFALLVPPDPTAVPLVVAAGPLLPVMGPMEPCGMAELHASIRFALGEGDAAARTLFTEPEPEVDHEEEARLNERLRQLYGE
jgi:hypothetical protein